jgi:hypothetical protein
MKKILMLSILFTLAFASFEQNAQAVCVVKTTANSTGMIGFRTWKLDAYNVSTGKRVTYVHKNMVSNHVKFVAYLAYVAQAGCVPEPFSLKKAASKLSLTKKSLGVNIIKQGLSIVGLSKLMAPVIKMIDKLPG